MIVFISLVLSLHKRKLIVELLLVELYIMNIWKLALKIELVAIFAGVLILLMLYLLFSNGYIRFNYPSQTVYPVRGIDVSNHQGIIDWNKIDNTLVHFAFIKATEGGDFKDKSFDRNWTNAKRNKIKVSAYHFFTFCRSGSEQAMNFIETVPNDTDMLPPAIDLEYSGNCKLTKTRKELLADIDDYIQIIEAEYNRRVIIYVTESFYNDYLVGLYVDNPLWIRDIYTKAHVDDKRGWTFWQYANNARIDGIPTLVDLNVYDGNFSDFQSFLSDRKIAY